MSCTVGKGYITVHDLSEAFSCCDQAILFPSSRPPYPFISCKFSQRKVHNCKLKIVQNIIFNKQSLMHIYIYICIYIYIINLFQSYKELDNLLVVSKMFDKVILLYTFCFLSFLSFISTSTKKHTLHLSATISYHFIYQ